MKTQPQTPESAAAQSDNVSLSDFIAFRASSRAETAEADGETGEEAQGADETLESEQGEESEASDTVANESAEAGDETSGEIEGEVQEDESTESQGEGEQAEPTIDDVIREAIAEAGASPDSKTAIAKMAKRIATIAAQRDAERAARIAAEKGTQNEGDAAPKPTVSGNANPQLTAVESDISAVKNALGVIARNPDGLEITDPKTGQIHSFSREDLLEKKANYEAQLTELVSERNVIRQRVQQQREQEATAARNVAATHYPWMANEKSPEFQLARQEIANLGWAESLKGDPRFPVIIGRYIRGLQAERAAAKTAMPNPKAKPTNGRVAPRVVPGPAQKTNVSPQHAKIKQAEAQFKATGSAKDFAKLRSLRKANAA